MKRNARGQASIEFVVLLPLLLTGFVLLLQVMLVGYALWGAGVAAKAGARAAYLGGDAEVAARSAVPTLLHRSMRVDVDEGEEMVMVRVGVRPPSLLPLLPVPRIEALSAFGVVDD